MVCEVDSEGRCKRHPFVQIQRRGRSGEWKALLDACPLCIIDDNKSVGSGGSRSKGSSAAGNGGIENLSAEHGAMVPLSRENSNQWGLDNLPSEATPSHSSRVTVKFAAEDAADNGNPDGVSMDPSSPDYYGNQPLRLPVHHDNHRRSYYQDDDDSQSHTPHGHDPHFSSGVSLASSTATGRYSTTGASVVSSSSNANNSVYSSKSARSAPGLQTQMRASALKSLPKYRACPQKMQQYAHVSGSVTTMSMDLDIDDDDSTEEGGGQDNRTMTSDASGSNSNANSNSNNSNSNFKSRELKVRDSKEGKDRTLQRKSSGDRQQPKPSRRDRHGNGGKVQNHPSRPDPEEYLGHDHQHSNYHSSRHNDSNGSNNFFQPPPPPASGPGQRFTIVSPSSRVDDDEVSAISFQSGLSQLQTNALSHGGYGNNNTPNNNGNGGGHNDRHRPLPGGFSSSHHSHHHHHSYGGRMNSALHNELKNFEMVPENDTLLSPAQPNHPPAASTLPFPIRDNRHGNNNNSLNNHHGNNNYNFQDPQDDEDEEDLTSTLPAINTNNYDSKGRCIAHPHIRLRKKKLLGRGWKVLMNACPDCCVEELRRIKLVESARRRKDRAELRQSLQAAASAQAMMAAASAGQGGVPHGYGNPQGLSSSMNVGQVGNGNGFAADSDDRNRHNNQPLRNSIQSGPIGGGMGRPSTGVGTRRISNSSGNSKNTNGSSPAVAPPPTTSTSFHSATPAKSTSFHSVSNSINNNNAPTSRGLPPPPPPPPPPQKQPNHKSSDETASLTNSSSGSSRDHNLSFASIHSNPAKQGINSSQDVNNNNSNITIKPSASGASIPKSSTNKDAVNNYGGISNGIQVKSMQWTDDKGNKGVYTGPVNSHFIPHGKGGKMEYDGGKVKEGEWKNGSLRRSSSHHRHHHHHRSSSTAPGDAGGNAGGKSSSRRDKEGPASSSSSSSKHGDERRSERKSSERRSTSAMRSSSRVKERGDGNFRSSGVGKSTSFIRSDKGSQ